MNAAPLKLLEGGNVEGGNVTFRVPMNAAPLKRGYGDCADQRCELSAFL